MRKLDLFGVGQGAIASAIERGLLEVRNKTVIFFPPLVVPSGFAVSSPAIKRAALNKEGALPAYLHLL